jgi:hypothetical protein
MRELDPSTVLASFVVALTIAVTVVLAMTG